MGNRKKKVKTINDDSLSKIFFWSGFDVFVILLLTCVVLGLITFFCNRLDADGIKLMLWCLLMVIPVSYALPMMSLLKVWRQERILKVYWKDRTDHERPMQEKDWYLAYNRGGFLLCHRAYIQRIFNSRVVEQTTGWGRENVYSVSFEDICRKKHTVKFSSARDQKRFQQWYENRCI